MNWLKTYHFETVSYCFHTVYISFSRFSRILTVNICSPSTMLTTTHTYRRILFMISNFQRWQNHYLCFGSMKRRGFNKGLTFPRRERNIKTMQFPCKLHKWFVSNLGRDSGQCKMKSTTLFRHGKARLRLYITRATFYETCSNYK